MPIASDLPADSTLLLSAKEKIKSVDRGTIVEVVRVIMEMIEDEDGIDGAEAQQHTIAIIRALIVDLAPDDDKDWLLAMVDNGTLANMIDTIIGATKGLYNLNQKGTSVGSCLRSISCIQLP